MNARSRGLATHLLGRPGLERLASHAELSTLGGELAVLGYVPAGDWRRSSATELETGVRRGAAGRLRTLERWCGSRRSLLVVLFEDEDRRSVRMLLRGAVQGAAQDTRMAGLIPSTSLPLRALEELARQPSVREIAVLLAAWGNPYGAPLLRVSGERQPDLFRLETVVNREFGARATRAARRAGPQLRQHVRDVIDLENAWAALVIAPYAEDVPLDALFVEGGGIVTWDRFLEVCHAGRADTAATRLAEVFGGSPFAAAFEEHRTATDQLEDAVLAAQLLHHQRAARLDPLSVATAITFALRLRAEVLDLSRIIWGVALDAPARLVAGELVTP